jgi:hypothetical protein
MTYTLERNGFGHLLGEPECVTRNPAAVMLRTLAETPGVAIRTELRLPPEIDALVVDTREEVLHFDPSIGWARHAAASLDL